MVARHPLLRRFPTLRGTGEDTSYGPVNRTGLPAATIFFAQLVLACGGSFEYELEAEAPSAQPAAAESTDGSWAIALGELLLPLIEDHDTEYAPGL